MLSRYVKMRMLKILGVSHEQQRLTQEALCRRASLKARCYKITMLHPIVNAHLRPYVQLRPCVHR